MLLIPKVGKQKHLLRTVVDLRARNANTRKVSAPLPSIDGILHRVAKAKFRSIIDGKDAYEQIRIIPEHVDRTTVTATYQALMNHIFSPYIGVFMEVYLDDVIIYSESLKDHIRHVKCIIDVLKREQLYLSQSKLNFLPKIMKVLGRIIDDAGIRMDPDKVDSVTSWKTPTRIRGPMGILHTLTGATVPFRWSYTEQRAFDEIKTVWMVTDTCSASVAGYVGQGDEWASAKPAAF